VAIFLNNKVGFKVGATPVDFTDHVTAFTLTQQSDQLEVTAMSIQLISLLLVYQLTRLL